MQKTGNGFKRLRGLAAASLAAAGAAISPAAVTAATRTLGFTLAYSSTGTDNRSYSLTGIDNDGGGRFTFLPTVSAPSSITVSGSGFAISELNNFTNSSGDGQYSFSSTCSSSTSTSGTLGDSHDDFMMFAVGSTVFQNPDNTVDVTDNVITTDVHEDIVTGINAALQIRIFPDKPVLRGILTLTNTTDEDIQVPVSAFGNMGSDECTAIQNTSDDDTSLEGTDTWVSSNDSDSADAPPQEDPVVVFGF